MEFAAERKPGTPVVYRVGQSLAAKDWYRYQPEKFDYQVARASRQHDWTESHSGLSGAKEPVPVPFEVDFDLAAPPRGKFVLQLDAILTYFIPASPRYVVEINGNLGSYELTPHPAPELWWPTGGDNIEFTGYQSLEMVLPASYFRRVRIPGQADHDSEVIPITVPK